MVLIRWVMMNTGCIVQHGIQVVPYFQFRFGIDGTGAIVQDKDFRFTEQGTGNADTLFLAAGNIDASASQQRIVTLGEGSR